VPNKATQDIKAFCREFLSSENYRQSAARRVLAGEAPHLETLYYHYGYGKPRETLAIEDGRKPLPLIIDMRDAND
jgi:hypothetical protein